MTNRVYRSILGLSLLLVMYFDLKYGMWAIIGILLFEGLTNLRIPKIVNLARNVKTVDYSEGCLGVYFKKRTGFEAERAWRLLVSLLLFISYVMYYELLWFFPWFMGFTIFGAGVSGVCPMFLMFKWFGFR